MIYLALAVSCSLAIGIIFKHAATRGWDRISLLTANYLVAGLIGFVLVQAGGGEGGLSATGGLLALGVFTGALFIAGFFIFALATHVAGMGLAVGVMRISVVIPFLASWLIWNEVPTPAQGIGLVVAGVAFFLIARRSPQPLEASKPDGTEMRTFGVLALLFAAGGIVDVCMKTFDEAFAATNSQALFLLLVFGVAFAIGAVLVVWKGIREDVWPEPVVLGWGAVLGAVNYGSAEFILRAIRELSGPFVFPANNIALVIGAALIGVTVWSERLTVVNWIGLGLAAGALVLLSV